jgi:hypothetical protein
MGAAGADQINALSGVKLWTIEERRRRNKKGGEKINNRIKPLNYGYIT